jgi:hypothetical protein
MWNRTLEVELGQAMERLLDIVYNVRGIYNKCPEGYQ